MSKDTLYPKSGRVKRRQYDSPVRRKQAALTRAAILEASRELFIERGYITTPITLIAERAEVSPQTVYGVFGDKRSVLRALMDEMIGGEEGPERLMETEGPQRMRQERDQRTQLRMLAGGVTGILERAGTLFMIMRDAAAADDEIAASYNEIHDIRYRNMYLMVGWVAANGSLKDGMSIEEATDIIWTLTSADVRHLLRNDRGWTAERYQSWLAETMISSILPSRG
jgi:AcrR family transcriptional regulator